MKSRELAVDCDWCGANSGEPCKSESETPYDSGTIHRARRNTYDEMQRLIKNRPTDLLPPKPRSIGKTRCVR